jgi:hypothetical protein
VPAAPRHHQRHLHPYFLTISQNVVAGRHVSRLRMWESE